jgi:DNA-binding transcriptional regulator GbsR (MarR family)
MNLSRQSQLLQSQSSLAKKVFDVVPIQDAWSCNYILSELTKATGSSPTIHAVRACLGDLEDNGLVKQTNNRFQRIAVKAQKVTSMSEIAQLVPKAEPTKEDTFSLLADLSAEMVDLGKDMVTRMTSISQRLEQIALSVETERKDNAQAAEKLKQLQTLLKGLTD